MRTKWRTTSALWWMKSTFIWLLTVGIALASTLPSNAVKNEVVNFDFRLGQHKESIIIVELTSPSLVVDLRQSDTGVMIELHNTDIVDERLMIIDVRDFSTEVEQIESFREGNNVNVEVKVRGAFEYSYQMKGRFLEVSISPTVAVVTQDSYQSNMASLEADAQPISINFQDIPIRHVLQLIADYNDFNLVVGDSVTGNLTLRLDGVPWPQVLDIILQLKGLDKRVEGNIVLVAPQSELAAQDKQALEQAKLASELAALQSEILQINYAKASEVAELIGGEGDITMLSSRGSITIDERTNSLLLRDVPQNIVVIKDIIKTLDVPVKQVQIEARIVTIEEGNLDELGVRWGFSSTNGSSTIGGSIESNLATLGLFEGAGEDGNGSSVPIDDFLNVNLGVSNPAASSIAFQVAKLGSDTLLDLELSALQAENQAEIISSPRLITTNKKSAYIEQGTELPYLEASSSGATSISFKKAVLSLKVTPQITPDNRLVLDLEVTQDKPGQVVKIGTGEAVAISTQKIGTQVLVNNGETVVLGGIFQHSLINNVEKVPLLGDIPLLGALFRRTYEQLGKRELLIFVTPKVVIQ